MKRVIDLDFIGKYGIFAVLGFLIYPCIENIVTLFLIPLFVVFLIWHDIVIEKEHAEFLRILK